MSKRKLFYLFYPIMKFSSLILYLIPKFVLQNLWIYLDLFPGVIGVGLRYIFALRLSKQIGKNVFIGRNVEIIEWGKLTIGDNVSIHKNCYIDATGEISIGNNVSIAHNCSILTPSHTWSDSSLPIKSNKIISNKIIINNDVWIGCGSRILMGVTIGGRSIIAAGSIVIKDVPSSSMVAGVPAIKKKSLKEK